jgi:hypothetical protein
MLDVQEAGIEDAHSDRTTAPGAASTHNASSSMPGVCTRT